MTDTDIAYIAGLFDGEGCIQIYHVIQPDGAHQWDLRCHLAQKFDYLPNLLKFYFGGSVRLDSKNHQVYKWNTSSRKSYEFLKTICPYLKIKKPQAELGIKYQERVMSHLGRGVLHSAPPKRLSDEELNTRESMRILMKELKTIGVKYE